MLDVPVPPLGTVVMVRVWESQRLLRFPPSGATVSEAVVLSVR